MKKIIFGVWLSLYTALAFAGLNNPTATQLSGVSSGQFYAGSGAVINRAYDRLFVGPASLNNGTNAASQPDWWTQYQLAKGRTYGFIQTSQFAVLNDSAGKDSLIGGLAGAQTAGRPASGSQAIGFMDVGINNANTGHADNAAWGHYTEAFRDTGVDGNGGVYGWEIDTMNFTSSTPVTDPYVQGNDQTIGLQMASGGGFAAGSLHPSTAAFNIQNNNSTYDKGIVFGSNSITGANGTSGSGVAIALGNGHMLQWYGAAYTPTSSILSNGTTTAAGTQLLFSDSNTIFRNSASKPLFEITGVSNAVNGVQVLGSTTGNTTAINAIGDDSNIALTLAGKGTSGVSIKGQTAGATVASGYVGETIKNNASGISLTTGTNANITSITLTPGDYDVSGTCTFVPANGTAPTLMQCGINTVSGTMGGIGTSSFLGVTFPTNGQTQGFVAPVQQINVSVTTTAYLIGVSAFTGGTMTANGSIFARRRD